MFISFLIFSLLPQLEFYFTGGFLFLYQRKGLCTNSVSCYLKVCSICRPYHGSSFRAHNSLPTDTAAVASQPKEWWNSIRTHWEHIPKALPPLGRTQGESPDVCNNDRPQKNQSEASNLEVPVGLQNTQGKKRIADMEIVRVTSS